MDNLAQHESLLRQMHDTYVKKNHDYGNSFGRSYQKYGMTAAMVRMEDKWNRLDNLVSGKKALVSDESIRDTCMDLANYLIMTVMEMDNQKQKENEQNFEKQVAELAIAEEDTEEPVETVTLHDEENGDIDVAVPKKLDKKTIDEGKVMALHKAKWSQAKIADEMGCSQGRISQIIKANK